MAKGDSHITALELAVEQYDLERGPDLPGDQLDLFANKPDASIKAAVETAPVPLVTGQQVERRAGRPPGARNKRTDELGRWYIQQNGGRDPLARCVYISGLPILAPGVLDALARTLGMDRADAARWWAGMVTATLPYLHQRLAQLTVLPVGAPGSNQPILWSIDGGEFVDTSVEPIDGDLIDR